MYVDVSDTKIIYANVNYVYNICVDVHDEFNIYVSAYCFI